MWLDEMRNWSRRRNPELLIETFTRTLMSPSKCSLNRQFLLGWIPSSSTHECFFPAWDLEFRFSQRLQASDVLKFHIFTPCYANVRVFSSYCHLQTILLASIFFFLSIPGCSVFACLLFLEKKHSVPKSLVKHSIKVLESPEMFRGIYDGGTPTALQGLDPKEASTTWMLMLWRYRVIYHKVICLWVLLCGARPVLKSWNLALVSPL